MAGIPQFRRSQGIVPFGAGAIVDFPDDSLMAAGLDMWPSESGDADTRRQVEKATEILDARLQARLSFGRVLPLRRFLMPIEAPELGWAGAPGPSHDDHATGWMPFVRFPHWHFCPRCRLLWSLPWNTPSGDARLRCNGTKRLRAGVGSVCNDLSARRRPLLVPVRFAVACEAGHIMDFPWIEWAHSGDGPCVAGNSSLFLHSTGWAGLEGVRVECVCGRGRSLAGAFGQRAFEAIWNSKCPGHRPWLGPDAREEGCNKRPQTVQRGASNIYFARIVSSILIPPYSEAVRQLLDRPDIWDLLLEVPRVDGEIPAGYLTRMANQHGVDAEILTVAVRDKLARRGERARVPQTEEEYRYTEYTAFHGTRPARKDRADFDIVNAPIGDFSQSFQGLVEKVVLVPRLRETRVLTGFTRLVPPDPSANQDVAALSLKPKPWLPGIKVMGEGIFLVLRESTLAAWEQKNDLIAQRGRTIDQRLRSVHLERGITPRSIFPRFILAHTFAHVLIRQLSFDCGYDASSLRERLYVSTSPSTTMCGILIYTASGDSEGTLGGLVRQGKAGRLEPMLEAAIANARLCSTDPLCIESDGQGMNSLNFAACHACTLLPETSCEEGNRLLDRAFLIGVPGSPETGYFSSIGVLT